MSWSGPSSGFLLERTDVLVALHLHQYVVFSDFFSFLKTCEKKKKCVSPSPIPSSISVDGKLDTQKHHCLLVNNPSLYFVKDWD